AVVVRLFRQNINESAAGRIRKAGGDFAHCLDPSLPVATRFVICYVVETIGIQKLISVVNPQWWHSVR
ncbi:MAG: hypothetical protein ACI8Z1_003681, partial [Candidatus Azotimanducaceae bacterium]